MNKNQLKKQNTQSTFQIVHLQLIRLKAKSVYWFDFGGNEEKTFFSSKLYMALFILISSVLAVAAFSAAGVNCFKETQLIKSTTQKIDQLNYRMDIFFTPNVRKTICLIAVSNP